MSNTITVYISRDNTEIFLLKYRPVRKYGYILVPKNTIIRAVFRFDTYCLDTDTDIVGNIGFMEDNTIVFIKPGLIPDLVIGQYSGWLTVYDALNPNGRAWGEELIVDVVYWNVCLLE